MGCGWSAGGGVLISLGELAVQPNEAESLFMELRIIFMIISTFSGSAALQNPPLFSLSEAPVHRWLWAGPGAPAAGGRGPSP